MKGCLEDPLGRDHGMQLDVEMRLVVEMTLAAEKTLVVEKDACFEYCQELGYWRKTPEADLLVRAAPIDCWGKTFVSAQKIDVVLECCHCFLAG